MLSLLGQLGFFAFLAMLMVSGNPNIKAPEILKTPIRTGSGNWPTDLAWADFNDEDRLDLIVANDLDKVNHPNLIYYKAEGNLEITPGRVSLGSAPPNGDESVNIGDAVNLINHSFHDGPAPAPAEVGDADCDGDINIGDTVYLLNYVFKEGSPGPCASCK